MSLTIIPELAYWLAFDRIVGVGPITMKRLRDGFPTLTDAWQASSAELHAHIDDAAVKAIITQRESIQPQTELEVLDRSGVQAITLNDDTYPPLLKEINDPPSILYYRGTIPYDQPMISIVGTRKMTDYGRRVTELLVQTAVEAGFVIVSGLALGIDACAHQACVITGGKTIAVLGNGADTIHPMRNRSLGEQIIKDSGVIISEFPIGTPPETFNFPRRNRVIAGLSRTTLVVEAAGRSGALITAQYALEYNRDVLAVPGSIFNVMSEGTHHLISLGARIIGNPDDLRDALGVAKKRKEKLLPTFDSNEEKNIYELLAQEPLHVDKLARLARLDIRIVNATLSIMEIKGVVKKQSDNSYTL